MLFTKMHSNGNDFIVIDNMKKTYSSEKLAEMAKCLCQRRLSVGADGILVLESSQTSDFTMRLFNSDGSEGEMCGNGARCIAAFAHSKGIASPDMAFSTLAGNVHACVDGPEVTLDMGFIDPQTAQVDDKMNIGGWEITYSFIVAGVPHVVIDKSILGEINENDMRALGLAIENRRDLFPSRTNVNFVDILDNQTLSVKTLERGVDDFTLSCGTGSTASAIINWKKGFVNQPVKVINPGGANHVLWTEEDNSLKVQLRGKVFFVYEASTDIVNTENSKC